MANPTVGWFRSPKRMLAWALPLAAVAVFLAPPRLAGAAPESPSVRYRDSNYKFSFLYFQGWAPVPVETKGKGISLALPSVAKFAQQGAEKRNVLNAEIEAFRLATGAAAEGATTTPGEVPAEVKKTIEDALGPKSMVDVFNRTIDGYAAMEKGYKPAITPKAAAAIQSKDDVPGQMWMLDRPAPWGGGDKIWWVFAAWKKDDVEIGLVLDCEGSQKKKYELGFKRVIDSFSFHDDKAKEAGTLDCLKDLPMSPGKKREIEKGLVKGWDVIVSPKKNYVVIYNTQHGRNKLLARMIAEQIEEIRAQVYELLFPPSEKVDAISIIRVCGDRMEYAHYGGPRGSAGYWSDDTEELVFYDASPKKAPDDDTLAVLYHEAFHQFIYYSVGEVAPHSWFNEGHGDYFAGAKYKGKQYKIGPFAWRVGLVKEGIRKGPCPFTEETEADGTKTRKWNRESEGYSPLKQLVEMDQGEYYAYPGMCYAQGWSLIYFLREIVPKNPKWNEKWGKILQVYFDTLKAEVNKDKPLKPKKEKKDDPPDGQPPTTPDGGDGTPPGMDGDPDPAPGGMDGGDPTPGGMDGGGTPPADDPGNPEDAMGIARSHSRYSSPEKALKKSLSEAFKGFKDADWEEFETAWKDSISKIPTPKRGD